MATTPSGIYASTASRRQRTRRLRRRRLRRLARTPLGLLLAWAPALALAGFVAERYAG